MIITRDNSFEITESRVPLLVMPPAISPLATAQRRRLAGLGQGDLPIDPNAGAYDPGADAGFTGPVDFGTSGPLTSLSTFAYPSTPGVPLPDQRQQIAGESKGDTVARAASEMQPGETRVVNFSDGTSQKIIAGEPGTLSAADLGVIFKAGAQLLQVVMQADSPGAAPRLVARPAGTTISAGTMLLGLGALFLLFRGRKKS